MHVDGLIQSHLAATNSPVLKLYRTKAGLDSGRADFETIVVLDRYLSSTENLGDGTTLYKYMAVCICDDDVCELSWHGLIEEVVSYGCYSADPRRKNN